MSAFERKPCRNETLDKMCAMYFSPLPCLFFLEKYNDFVCNNYEPVKLEETYGKQVQEKFK